MPGARFADFEIEQATLELRFAQAYLLWDRGGALWTEAQRSIKDLVLIQSQPSQMIFRQGRRFEFSTDMSVARVVDVQPSRNLDDLQSLASKFFKIVVEHLQIEKFTRVGCRIMYRRVFETMGAASVAIVSTGLLQIPDKTLFGLKGPALLPEASFRFEQDGKGITARFRAEERKVELTLPLGADLSALVKKLTHVEYAAVLDFDYFLTGLIDPAQIEFGEWIKQVVHIINRDVPRMITE